MSNSEYIEKIKRVSLDLPSGWAISALEEISQIVMGQSPPSSAYNTKQEGLPFFQGKAEFGSLYPKAVKWCTQPAKVARKGDVLISVRAPVGPTNLAPSECCIGRGLAAIRPFRDIPSKYVLYYLRSIESDIESLGTGTTFKAISGPILRSLLVPLAPSSQLRRIVAEIEKQFSRLDEAVISLKRAKANLKRYKAAVLKAAVEGKLTEQWRKEHPDVEPASKLLERILAERHKKWEEVELTKMKGKGQQPRYDKWKGKYQEPFKTEIMQSRGLPQGWVWVSFDSLMDHDSPQNGLYKNIKHLTASGGTPLLDIKGLYKGFSASFGGMRRFKLEDIEKSHYMLEEGNILVNRVSKKPEGVGKSVLVENLPEQTVFESNMMRIRLPQNVVPRFINYFLNSEEGRAGILRKAKMTQQASINQADIKSLPIPFAPLREQSIIVGEIDQRLSVLAGSEAAIEADLKRAERLRQSILKKAFSGRLVLQIENQSPN